MKRFCMKTDRVLTNIQILKQMRKSKFVTADKESEN